MHGILGSGFGLYGYLPALLQHQSGPVLVLQDARERLLARPELAWTLPRITWTADRQELLARASVLAIALPPELQQQLLESLAPAPGLQAVLLEKPVACSPQPARQVLGIARAQQWKLRVGYTLPHTRWFASLAARPDLRSADRLELEWTFMAHHFRTELDTWKRHHVQGGGVLRFYAIQILALLERLGYRANTSAKVSGDAAMPERVEAEASAQTLPPLQFRVDSRNSTTAFRMRAWTGKNVITLLELPDPFARETLAPLLDTRIDALRGILGSLREDDAAHDAAGMRVIDLWEQAEDCAREGLPP